MAKMFYLMGTDGAGKTTLSSNLMARFEGEGRRVKYLYARHRPILIYPLKLASKIMLYRKNSQFGNYEAYSDIKSGFSRKHAVAARIYAGLWVIDYLVYYLLPVRLKTWFADYVIVDRYVGDVAVNISIAAGMNTEELGKLVRFLHRFFPLPTASFFIQVDEEEAFRRKDDIPSVQYLRERKEKYFALRSFYSFRILDGHRTQSELVEEFYQSAAAELQQNGVLE